MTFQLPSRKNYHHLDDAPNDNPYNIDSHQSHHSHTDSIPEPPLQIQMHTHADSITEYTNEKTTDPAQATLLNHIHYHDHDNFEATRPLQAHLAPSDSSLPPPATHSALNSLFLSPAERFERAIADSERDDYMRIRPKGFCMYSLANTKTEWHHGSRGRVLKYWVGFPLLAGLVIVVVVIIVLAILGFSKIGITQ